MLVTAGCCHDDSIAEAPARKFITIKPVQGSPGSKQPSHTLEVDGKGRKRLSKGGESPRHRVTAGVGEDARLELGPGVIVTASHAQQHHTGKLASPLLPPPSSPKPPSSPVNKLVCHSQLQTVNPCQPEVGEN